MVNSFSVNASSMVRPGTFVSQRSISSNPVPIANHAVAYLFGTVEDDLTELEYKGIQPYVPTQITSVNDYVEKVGGVPRVDAGARTTYDAVNSYFSNVGSNGILYLTRVTPTPETVLEVPLSVTAGYNTVVLTINGVQYGDVVNEFLGKVIVSSGIDAPDIAYDIYSHLLEDSNFTSLFNVEEITPNDALNRRVRITSKESNVLVDVEAFKVYKSGDIAGTEMDLLDYVKNYFPSKNVNLRLKTNLIDEIVFIDGEELKAYATAEALPFSTDGERATLLTSFLSSKSITPVQGYYYPVSPSGDSTFDAALNKWNVATTVAAGVITALNTTATVAPARAINSIQVFYLEIAGQSQAIVLNAATAEEFALNVKSAVESALTDAGLVEFYELSAVDIDPVNEIYLRPTLSPITTEVQAEGTVTLATSVLTGAGTAFLTELIPGMKVYIGDNRYTIATVTSNTAATIVETGTADAGSSLYIDRSEATGFYAYDYVVQLNIKSKNGTLPPVFPGVNRAGDIDLNVSYTSAADEELSYLATKYFQGNKVKAQDFVFAIRKVFGSAQRLEPGFILAPEAFSTLRYIAGEVTSKSEALDERLKVASAIALAAEGRGDFSGFEAAAQHVGLIDCGGDIENLGEARDELLKLRSIVGSAFGHLCYYAPYIRNSIGNYVPLSPYVAGIACSRYIIEGFQQPPAGARYPLRDATGLKFTINSQQQETTYALGLNPAREMPNRGVVVWGGRTISGNTNFKYINTRVILNVLIDVLNRSFDDLLFDQIDSAQNLFTRVSAIASSVCFQFYRQGALFGASPGEAYSVVCSFQNNTYALVEAGTVVCDIYVATSPTLERVLISVARTPAGQVSLINESLSRNNERFANIASTTI